MELALLTDAYLVITIYDPSDYRATTFQSHTESKLPADATVVTHERFMSEDVSSEFWADVGE